MSSRAFKKFNKIISSLIPYKVRRVEEIPDTSDPFVLYLVGQNQFLWNASMICPCGCEELLQMSLMPEGRPQWFVHFHRDGKISLSPSIWRTVGCKSHFFFSKNKIKWIKETKRFSRNRFPRK